MKKSFFIWVSQYLNG